MHASTHHGNILDWKHSYTPTRTIGISRLETSSHVNTPHGNTLIKNILAL